MSFEWTNAEGIKMFAPNDTPIRDEINRIVTAHEAAVRDNDPQAQARAKLLEDLYADQVRQLKAYDIREAKALLKQVQTVANYQRMRLAWWQECRTDKPGPVSEIQQKIFGGGELPFKPRDWQHAKMILQSLDNYRAPKSPFSAPACLEAVVECLRSLESRIEGYVSNLASGQIDEAMRQNISESFKTYEHASENLENILNREIQDKK